MDAVTHSKEKDFLLCGVYMQKHIEHRQIKLSPVGHKTFLIDAATCLFGASWYSDQNYGILHL